jgi:hypothetical protein
VSVGEQLVSSHRTQDDPRGVLDMRRKLKGPLRSSRPVYGSDADPFLDFGSGRTPVESPLRESSSWPTPQPDPAVRLTADGKRPVRSGT